MSDEGMSNGKCYGKVPEAVARFMFEEMVSAMAAVHAKGYKTSSKSAAAMLWAADEIESLRAQVAEQEWKYEMPTVSGFYVVKFYLDQGMGHGHEETLICEYSAKHEGFLRPDFAGVGNPSLLAVYGPIPELLDQPPPLPDTELEIWG